MLYLTLSRWSLLKKETTATFIGHNECYGVKKSEIIKAIKGDTAVVFLSGEDQRQKHAVSHQNGVRRRQLFDRQSGNARHGTGGERLMWDKLKDFTESHYRGVVKRNLK